MKLVIDIPEELYREYKDRPPMLGDAGMDMIARAIANGIPLDKIRAELHATAEMHEDGDYYLREEWIDEIIDKYKAEVDPQESEMEQA